MGLALAQAQFSGVPCWMDRRGAKQSRMCVPLSGCRKSSQKCRPHAPGDSDQECKIKKFGRSEEDGSLRIGTFQCRNAEAGGERVRDRRHRSHEWEHGGGQGAMEGNGEEGGPSPRHGKTTGAGSLF